MILPNDYECQQIVAELKDEPELDRFEHDFVTDNQDRQEFSDKQKEVCWRLANSYILLCYQPK